ncbi:restriction endonuclease [Hyphomicrobium sp. xq]|uniref:Restriction endonuclease n=1 Tax=Hyphomicrobium album TaxID=2665159 RepID=A0A6I3KJI8_9HYPH|nr:restriction endonuclease [Hyphomicrobium album]MTD93917.1 restriction endonuclease [Hyphomicrobium album]
MSRLDPVFWGIHAGRTGDADELFLRGNCVAIGWADLGNLSAIGANREAFKAKVISTYADIKPGAVPQAAGQPFRFVHEMKVGDLVIYPAKQSRQVHIGRVEGEYEYDTGAPAGYPNRRKVTWLKSAPRTHFSQGALYEIGSALSLFQVRNFADEFRALVDGKAPETVVSAADDLTVARVAEDIEETTKDFVLKQLARDLKGTAFEGFVAHLLECMGYHARLARTNEPSVDIIAHKDHLGIEPPIIKVQVKSGDGSVSDRDVSALFGKLAPGEYGLFVTLGDFSAEALRFERSKSNLRVIDGEEIVQLIFENYEKFDTRHKGLLPLRRVYIPETSAAEGE